MEQLKTMKIRKEVGRKLALIKIEDNFKSFSDVIEFLIEFYFSNSK